MAELTLTCWIRSQDATVFRIKNISSTSTVGELQEKIKEYTSGDVRADDLPLYKPRKPLSKPFQENLAEFVLANDAERLNADDRLSQFFSQDPPAKGHIHIIVDAPSEIECRVRGDRYEARFYIAIHPYDDIDDLTNEIKNQRPKLKGVPYFLIYRVSGDEEQLRESLRESGRGELLRGGLLAPNFMGVPVLDPLCVVIEAGAPNPALEPFSTSQARVAQQYQGIIIKVKQSGKFTRTDLEENEINEAPSNMNIPDYVFAFQEKLHKKPRLPYDMPNTSRVVEYFEPYQVPTAENPREDLRYADELEMAHTALWIAPYEWKNGWNSCYGIPLKEPVMDAMFFSPFRFHDAQYGKDTVRIKQSLDFDVIVECEDVNDDKLKLRKFRPCPNLFISKSSLPRLLVEVNSATPAKFPSDCVRMLATGAFIVRFANNFVSTFSQKKDFVLCALYVRIDGSVKRYVLFQNQNQKTVYYTERCFQFDQPVDRVEFARHLYNLLSEQSDDDQAAKDATAKLCEVVHDSNIKSLSYKASTEPPKKKRRTEGNYDDAASGGNRVSDKRQLRAHGYEVEPEDIVDDQGDIWEPLFKPPDHIFTVYRASSPDEKFIAKKVRKESNELDTLNFLNTVQPKSFHVIWLVDSFDGFAILPKRTTVDSYVDVKSGIFESEVPRVCRGLIEGLGYLHQLRVAHRDIKPDNLVVDQNFTLQIIDFDVAIRLEDEDEEVDDWCGTQGWMAPEVEKKLRHSPIRADRWSCGRVLLYLQDEFDIENYYLKAITEDLVKYDPKERWSLVELGCRWPRPFSDVWNAPKAPPPRRNRTEVDGEDTNTPNAKKQRLE